MNNVCTFKPEHGGEGSGADGQLVPVVSLLKKATIINDIRTLQLIICL